MDNLSHVEATDIEIKRALISTAIEKVLLDMGKPVLDIVTYKLYNEYNCYIPNCYENPEYLKKILKNLYGTAHLHIIKLINQDLEEYNQQQPIKQFLHAVM